MTATIFVKCRRCECAVLPGDTRKMKVLLGQETDSQGNTKTIYEFWFLCKRCLDENRVMYG